MFICDELIYIQMQKTGCSHIALLLSKLFEGETIGSHNSASLEQLKSTNYFISSIRNPWDWYLSLWTFGVQGRGGFMHHLTKRELHKSFRSFLKNPKKNYQVFFSELTKNVKIWRSVYDRSDHVESFRKWLRLINERSNSRYISKRYGNAVITSLCGLMTFRYLYLCCCNVKKLKKPGLISSIDELIQFDSDNCYIDYFIRQEALEDTFCEAIEQVRPLTQKERELIFGLGRTNTSVRMLSIADYYDKESIDLIRSRDRLIIEKFDYSPPKRQKIMGVIASS